MKARVDFFFSFWSVALYKGLSKLLYLLLRFWDRVDSLNTVLSEFIVILLNTNLSKIYIFVKSATNGLLGDFLSQSQPNPSKPYISCLLICSPTTFGVAFKIWIFERRRDEFRKNGIRKINPSPLFVARRLVILFYSIEFRNSRYLFDHVKSELNFKTS